LSKQGVNPGMKKRDSVTWGQGMLMIGKKNQCRSKKIGPRHENETGRVTGHTGHGDPGGKNGGEKKT